MAGALSEVEIDQVVKAQCLAIFSSRRGWIATDCNLGEQPFGLDPCRLCGPRRAMFANRQPPFRRTASGTRAVIDGIGLSACRGHNNDKALHLGIADKIVGIPRQGTVDSALGYFSPH